MEIDRDQLGRKQQRVLPPTTHQDHQDQHPSARSRAGRSDWSCIRSADTVCSHVEQGGGRLVIGRERGRRRILYRHEMLPQELRFLR